MIRSVAGAVTCVLLAACASGSGAPRQSPAPSTFSIEESRNPRLYAMLSSYPLSDEHRDSLAVYAQVYTTLTDGLLAEAANDADAPTTVRVNALYMLSQRQAVLELPAFRSALDDEDPRVRATAVASMREFLQVRPDDALRLARSGLQDPDAQVQAQALAILGTADVPLLRRYVARTSNAELGRVASDLVSTAEERGAPLHGDSATGELRRISAHGYALHFVPDRRWPEWEAALGSVTITGNGRSFTVDSIEVVRGVVPLFFSPDGEYVVYERGRRIHVRNLASGQVREIGLGLAPRIRPFTDGFIYFRELPEGRTEVRERTQLLYDVVTASFDGGEAQGSLGTLNAVASHGNAGSFSPVRWIFVEDRGGSFFLAADQTQMFPLPDPFAEARGGA